MTGESIVGDLQREVVQVKVTNWKPDYCIQNTTVKTYVLDPAAAVITQRWAQIAEYEPERARMVIQVLDSPIVLTKESPNVAPETTAAGVAPGQQGRVLVNNTGVEYCFYGPDAWFVIPTAAVTRVTVTKEYRGVRKT
jgi:hypothetical protein